MFDSVTYGKHWSNHVSEDILRQVAVSLHIVCCSPFPYTTSVGKNLVNLEFTGDNLQHPLQIWTSEGTFMPLRFLFLNFPWRDFYQVLSSFTHPHEILNMHDSSVEHENRYSEECGQPNSFGDHWLAMYGEKKNISPNTFLYSAEQKSNDKWW